MLDILRFWFFTSVPFLPSIFACQSQVVTETLHDGFSLLLATTARN